jgi:hypothetical protein
MRGVWRPILLVNKLAKPDGEWQLPTYIHLLKCIK